MLEQSSIRFEATSNSETESHTRAAEYGPLVTPNWDGIDRRRSTKPIPRERRRQFQSKRSKFAARTCAMTQMAMDLFALLVSTYVAIGVGAFLATGQFSMSVDLQLETKLLFSLPFLFVTVLTFWLRSTYHRRRHFVIELHEALNVLALMALVHTTAAFYAGWDLPRMSVISLWLVALMLIPITRLVTKQALLRIGIWQNPTLIVGTDDSAKSLAKAFLEQPRLGYEVIGFAQAPKSWLRPELQQNVRSTKPFIELDGNKYPVYQLADSPAEWLESMSKPHVVVTSTDLDFSHVVSVLHGLNPYMSGLSMVPNLVGVPIVGTEISHLFRYDIMLLGIQNNLSRAIPRRVKRLFDLIVGGTALLVLTPLLLIVSAMIASTGTSVLFRQTRIGKHGEKFKCLKFQTMVTENQDALLEEHFQKHPEARAEWESSRKLKDDPRITRVGAILRRTSIDELPQLINVMRGEMSLVGPRPIVVDELPLYGDDACYYMAAKPGITGLWQISGRSQTTFARRVELDAWYCKNWSVWYDIVILVKTLKEVFSTRGAY